MRLARKRFNVGSIHSSECSRQNWLASVYLLLSIQPASQAFFETLGDVHPWSRCRAARSLVLRLHHQAHGLIRMVGGPPLLHLLPSKASRRLSQGCSWARFEMSDR